MSLLSKLKLLRPQIAAKAQAEYDAWAGDGDDPEIGSGGICDAIANEIGDVLAGAGIDSIDGGQDGDDHAFLIAYDDTSAYVVDIPPGVYERGSGYSWKKIPGVTITEDDVVIEKFQRSLLDEHITEENPPIDKFYPLSVLGENESVFLDDIEGMEDEREYVVTKVKVLPEKLHLPTGRTIEEMSAAYTTADDKKRLKSIATWITPAAIAKTPIVFRGSDSGDPVELIDGAHRLIAWYRKGWWDKPITIWLVVPRTTTTSENPPIDFKKIDLQARFDALNKKIFGGELPQIPLSFTKSKNASGMTDIKIVSRGMSISYLRMLNEVKPSDATITVTAIKINSVRIYDDSEFDGIIAHEMIHALLALRGYPFEHHGLHFLKMRREINEKYGMDIPLSHDLSEAGVDAKEREVGIMVLGKREGEAHEAFLMFQPKALDAFMERYDASYARSWRTSIKFYILHTKAWAATTVKTKPDKYGVKLSWLKPALGIDLSNAWLVRSIVPEQKKEDVFAKMEAVATEIAREPSRNPARGKETKMLKCDACGTKTFWTAGYDEEGNKIWTCECGATRERKKLGRPLDDTIC